MTTRILALLDGSALSDRISLDLSRLLLAGGVDVHLLTIVGHERLVDDARAHLDETGRRFEELGAAASGTVIVGEDCADRALTFADRHSPDLVTVATHCRRSLARWAQPSVAEELVRRSAAPVLVANRRWLDVAERARPIRKIVVAVDDASGAVEVLPIVEHLARAQAVELLLLHVEFVPVLVPVTGNDAFVPPPDVLRRLTPLVQRLERQGIAARPVAAYGPTVETIVAVAEREDADLIAMTTHGRTGLSRALKGSITEAVLRECARPLLVSRVQRSSPQRR